MTTIVSSGLDLRRRDHVGRTPLQVAILCQNTEIACDLIDAGARMTARVVDGRTSLHLAAELGLNDVIKKLLQKSEANKVEAEEKAKRELEAEAAKEKEGEEEEEDDPDRPSSDDDWSSVESDRPKKKIIPKKQEGNSNLPPAEDAAIPEDNENLPDILDIAITDWDHQLSPLCHAIVRGHIDVVDTLLAAGGDAKTPTKAPDYNAPTLHPLALSFLIEDEQVACKIAERLIQAGAIITAADSNAVSLFHRAIASYPHKLDLAQTLLRCDPNANIAVNFLAQPGYNTVLSPLVTAITQSRAMTALLLANGAKPVITEEDYDRARNASPGRYFAGGNLNRHLLDTSMPTETSLRGLNDIYILLVALGVDVNLIPKDTAQFRITQYVPSLCFKQRLVVTKLTTTT